MIYAHLASKVFDRPLLISPARLDVILWVLRDRLSIDQPDIDPAAVASVKRQAMTGGVPAEPVNGADYSVIGGVAVIPAVGTLVQRAMGIDALSGVTSYESLAADHAHAMQNPDVNRLLYDFDTGGGEANGLFDTVDRIKATRGQKPVVAMVNEDALSAGYALASAADEIVITRTGSAGSIGVVATHRSMEKANEKRGVVMTHIFAGDHKVDGSPHFALSESAKATFQQDVDTIYALFVETVAGNRGLSPQAVRDTQARIYMGQSAIDVGLADRISTPSAELANQIELAGARNNRVFLTVPRIKIMGDIATIIEISQIDLDAKLAAAKAEAVAGKDAEQEEAKAAAVTAAVVGERERVAAILDCAAAKDRQQLARHLALHTDTTPEAATQILEATPLAKDLTGFAAAMAGTKQPNIAAEDMAGEGGEPVIGDLLRASFTKAGKRKSA